MSQIYAWFQLKTGDMSRDCEQNKMNNQAFAKLARKSVALKPYKFEHNNSTDRVCAMGTCVALCQLKVICVRPLIILIFAHFAENNNYIYLFIVLLNYLSDAFAVLFSQW